MIVSAFGSNCQRILGSSDSNHSCYHYEDITQCLSTVAAHPGVWKCKLQPRERPQARQPGGQAIQSSWQVAPSPGRGPPWLFKGGLQGLHRAAGLNGGGGARRCCEDVRWHPVGCVRQGSARACNGRGRHRTHSCYITSMLSPRPTHLLSKMERHRGTHAYNAWKQGKQCEQVDKPRRIILRGYV